MEVKGDDRKMNYDFYAEFWDEEKLDDFIKREMKMCWEDIWRTSRKPENKRPNEFEEKIIEILPASIYEEFILKDEKTHNFIKFLDALHQYMIEKEEYYNRFLESLKKSYKERGRNKDAKPTFPKELVKSFYKIFIHDKKQYNAFTQQQIKLLESLNIKFKENDIIDLFHLPPYSFFLSMTFTLKKPFISKDDEEFYIHENPVSKEKVFKVPYVRASSWKGNLRWVALKNLLDKISKINDKNEKWKVTLDYRTRIVRVFGNEKENREDAIFKNIFPEEIDINNKKVNKFNHEFRNQIIKNNYVNKDGNRRGRLQLYPTFFNKIGLDVINPHDRETRAGKSPITIEVVPEGANGIFSLLYVPFDLIGEDESKVKTQVKEDLGIIFKAADKMLTVYGFSAKKTSGYGIVNTGDSFKFELNDEKIKDLDLKNISGNYSKSKELLGELGVDGNE